MTEAGKWDMGVMVSCPEAYCRICTVIDGRWPHHHGLRNWTGYCHGNPCMECGGLNDEKPRPYPVEKVLAAADRAVKCALLRRQGLPYHAIANETGLLRRRDAYLLALQGFRYLRDRDWRHHLESRIIGINERSARLHGRNKADSPREMPAGDPAEGYQGKTVTGAPAHAPASRPADDELNSREASQ